MNNMIDLSRLSVNNELTKLPGSTKMKVIHDNVMSKSASGKKLHVAAKKINVNEIDVKPGQLACILETTSTADGKQICKVALYKPDSDSDDGLDGITLERA